MNKKQVFNYIIVPILATVVCFLLGICFKDYYLGPITLTFGFLGAFYIAKGKWYGYALGLGQCIFNAIICFINGLYATVILSALIYIPMQLFGIINWNKHQQDSEVVVKKLSIKNTICMFIGVAVLSVGFGFLLSLIPSQNMAYLDSVCQVINVFGVLLNILRFRESWWVWIVNNIINEVIWVINVIKHTSSAEMMLISSTMYLIMNFVSIYSWLKIEHKQKQQRQENI